MTTGQKVILFDLDDSLHEAEGHLFDYGWNHVLKPWGYVWRPKTDEETQAIANNRLTAVTEEQRPGIGVRPIEVARHFINVLGLDIQAIDREMLEIFGFNEDHIGQLLELKDATLLSSKELESRFAAILESERIVYFVNRILQEGIIPLDGYDVVRKLHETGVKVGIVTNAPLQIASLVLERLGLIVRGENGRISREKSSVDVIVSGQMPEKPKPDKAPLVMANFIISWNSITRVDRTAIKEQLAKKLDEIGHTRSRENGALTEDEKRDLRKQLFGNFLEKPLAMFGDSGSDVRAASAYGIPIIVVRRSEYSDEGRLRKLGATHIVESFAEIKPEMLIGEPTARVLPQIER